MKIFLYAAGAVAFVFPILLWAYMVQIGCAYNLSGGRCGITFSGYFDQEFFSVAFIPWCITWLCIYFIRRINLKVGPEE